GGGEAGGGVTGEGGGADKYNRRPRVPRGGGGGVKVEDRPPLPVLQPPVAGDTGVVLVGLAVPLPPLVELALDDPQPGDEPTGRDLGPLRPAADEVDDRVAGAVSDPRPAQGAPSAFFSRRGSSISSGTTPVLQPALVALPRA